MREFDRYEIECYLRPEIGAPPVKRWGDRVTLNERGVKYFSPRECEEYFRARKSLRPEDRSLSVLEVGCKRGEIRLRYNRMNRKIEVDFGICVLDIQDVTCDLSKYK